LRGVVFDIDHFAVHDGPGIRTTVYLKGCPLNCLWCHSPESQEPESQLLYSKNRCTGCMGCLRVCTSRALTQDGAGRRIYNPQACIHCHKCVSECPSGAISVCGRTVDSDEVVEEASQDSVFYRNSGGGVTLTGGEVLSQPEFAVDILKGLKARGVHTIVETSGMGSWDSLNEIASFTDMFYYDLKIFDPMKHTLYCGAGNGIIIGNLEKLRAVAKEITIRVPLIPGITDTPENIDAIYGKTAELSIRDIHLLPYNQSAQAKYELLDREYKLSRAERQDEGYLNSLVRRAPECLNAAIV
jgi:pyruvate formate lyase activating enzyme